MSIIWPRAKFKVNDNPGRYLYAPEDIPLQVLIDCGVSGEYCIDDIYVGLLNTNSNKWAIHMKNGRIFTRVYS